MEYFNINEALIEVVDMISYQIEEKGIQFVVNRVNEYR